MNNYAISEQKVGEKDKKIKQVKYYLTKYIWSPCIFNFEVYNDVFSYFLNIT